MLHESPASLPPLVHRPRKRRRTATEVLAGYFDSSNISRDFFTDMANTDETIRAVNSIIARNSPLLIDSRFQHMVGSFKSQTHGRHSSLNSRLRNNNNTMNINSIENTSPIDRRAKLMGRIQDISHLLLSDHYESEFAKRSPPHHTSLNLPTCNTQPDDNLQNPAPSSPPSQNLPTEPTPIHTAEDQSPRQLVLPEIESEISRRSPSIVIMEQASEPQLARKDAVVVLDTRTHCHRASMTASPPTPTRSIASLTSHTSSKWPHTPDNEAGPSFSEIPESYSDYATYHLEADNTGLTIVQPQSPPSSPPMWQQGPSAASTSKPPSVTGTPQWMTQVRLAAESSQPPRSSSRAFSLDNILSPPILTNSPPPITDDVSSAMEVDTTDITTTPSARPTEDIQIPFMMKTPEREMSVASDHLPKSTRSRRRSRAMKIVESDEETEGEREKSKKLRESDRHHLHHHRKPTKLKIRIGPLNNATTPTITSVPTAVTVPITAATEMGAFSSKEDENSSNDVISTASATASSAQMTVTPDSSQVMMDVLPPLIPGKARKRKAPPAKKGWKGWVEVEVEEGERPPKGFSLDALPRGERRTRSGKQFDG